MVFHPLGPGPHLLVAIAVAFRALCMFRGDRSFSAVAVFSGGSNGLDSSVQPTSADLVGDRAPAADGISLCRGIGR